MAPVTRCRAINGLPQPAVADYYSQRSTPGGLLITEAVAVSPQAIGFPHSPGIYNKEQIDGWKMVVDAVHKKGALIFCQIWHVGRASHTYYQPKGGSPVSSTNRRIGEGWYIRMPNGQLDHFSAPRALQIDEIKDIVVQFQVAAKNARLAGFDGVEIHAAHGYLIDQFLKDGINDRMDDEYGGGLDNRCRFCLEIVSAVSQEIGPDRVGIRLSPVVHHIGASDSNPIALSTFLLNKLNRFNLAYVHMTEPRFTARGVDPVEGAECGLWASRLTYKGRLICSGGFTKALGMQAVASNYADLVGYGRLFVSNPDLPLRFAIDAKLNEYDASTFYTHDQVKGYTDYPFL